MSMPSDNNSSVSTCGRGAAEWGLASLLMGGMLCVAAILTLQINLQMYLVPRAWPLEELRTIRDAAIVGASFVLVISLASVVFGIRGAVLAYRNAQPCALGWGGFLLSFFALLLWIGTFVDLLGVLDMLAQRRL